MPDPSSVNVKRNAEKSPFSVFPYLINKEVIKCTQK